MWAVCVREVLAQLRGLWTLSAAVLLNWISLFWKVSRPQYSLGAVVDFARGFHLPYIDIYIIFWQVFLSCVLTLGNILGKNKWASCTVWKTHTVVGCMYVNRWLKMNMSLLFYTRQVTRGFVNAEPEGRRGLMAA